MHKNPHNNPHLLSTFALTLGLLIPAEGWAESKAQETAINSVNFAKSNCQNNEYPARCKKYATKSLARIAALPSSEQTHPNARLKLSIGGREIIVAVHSSYQWMDRQMSTT
jgi:hypothetical protein